MLFAEFHSYGRKGAEVIQEIAATFEDGVFKPDQQPTLPEKARVRLHFERSSTLTVGELNAFLSSLPSLGDDADRFAEDVRGIRFGFPSNSNP